MTSGNPYDLGQKANTDFGNDVISTILKNILTARFRELNDTIVALQNKVDALEERMDRIPGCPGVAGNGIIHGS